MKRGDIVELTFLDHVQNAEEPMEFLLYGVISKLCKKYIVVQVWAHPDLDVDGNTELYTIVRSCVTKSRILT